jgi:DNA uptake protein ComE-like DNA-binding protein
MILVMFRRSVARTGVLSLVLFSTGGCSSADSDTLPETGTPAVSETAAPGGSTNAAGAEALLNPNLAGESDLAAVAGMNGAAVQAILAGRPFMDMVALDQAISSHVADREPLYAALWVPLNLNTASEEEILLIPGVGDRMAHEFDEYRPYDGMARFRREIGKYVDEAEVERLAGYVFVPIELNTATDEEILAIPGVGDRMLHEFKEYRPYTSMDQFMREIGKYVDDAELARLARYVTLANN